MGKEPEGKQEASIETLVLKIEELIGEVKESRKDIGAAMDAIQELTKVVGELNAAWEKWRKAGKF